MRSGKSGLVFCTWALPQLVMLFGAMLSVPLVSGSGAPRTWIVDDDGPADFHLIQEAINAASAGDSIYVRAGAYHENVVVNKTNLTLTGESKEVSLIDGNGSGIVLRVLRIQATNIINFTLRNGTIGLDLYESSYTYLRNIGLENSTYNFRVWGDFFEDFIHDIDNSNKVNGKPVYYWLNQKGKEVPADAGYVALINSTNMVIRDLNLSSNWDGALFCDVKDSLIENVSFSNNKEGLFLIYSKKNRILKNTLFDNGAGIILYGRSNTNNVRENVITNNEDGIYIGGSHNNTIRKNVIADSKAAIGGSGIFLEGGSQNNTILENIVENNTYGVRIIGSDNNRIYHNSFLDNRYQAETEFSYRNSTNVWDDGYPSGGNLWSDYNGSDFYSGPYQNVIGSDGIGDSPYTIDANNRDRYPLMNPFEAYISVPHHYQITSYYCGPAALEMVFDFYGPDVSLFEIADVARTAPPPDGTYTFDMIRAAHFSNLSTSVGREMLGNVTGYTTRKLGYAAFEHEGMSMGEVKSLIAAGYPIIVLTTWHYRVAVGYNSTHITFQDSWYGPMYNMTYEAFDTDWDYSDHWGLLVSPWKVEVSTIKNIFLGSVFNVTATITYPSHPPFLTFQYPASVTNATVTLPLGLTLVSGETAKKTVDTGHLTPGASANVTWTVRADNLGNYTISVEAEGKVSGSVPPLLSYPEYSYQDRIGGFSESTIAVSQDEIPPVTFDDYDGLWHITNFTITLTATDSMSGVAETYYKINDSEIQNVTAYGYPLILTEDDNNTLEYWSIDNAGNEESHHSLTGIRLDRIAPRIGIPSQTPESDVLPDQPVKVSINVTDTVSMVKNVTLSYTINDEATWQNLTMNFNPSTSLYEATIPAQPLGTLVKYRITAQDKAQNQAIKDNTGKYYVYLVVPELMQNLIFPIFMALTTLVIILTKKQHQSSKAQQGTTQQSQNFRDHEITTVNLYTGFLIIQLRGTAL